METIHLDYQSKGVDVFFVYKSLAHPEGGSNNYVQPFTLTERLMHIAESKKTLGSTIPWICDTMENDLKHALGDRPNSEFVIDPEGTIVRIRGWSSPIDLRNDMEELVGKVEKPTQVADLNLKIDPTPKPAASGVVPRVKSPSGMQAVLVTPQEGKNPFYVKLRVEVDQNVLRGEKGQMYLGFHLDPIYHVHWNNLAKPISYSVKPAGSGSATPAEASGPKVTVESDIDPREFLVEFDPANSKDEFEVTVNYFACNDEQGFCIPVTQVYTVSLERDRDAGSPRRPGGAGGGQRPGAAGGQRPAGAGEGQGPNPNPDGQRPAGQPTGGRNGMTADRLFSYDANKDGKLTVDELSGGMKSNFARMDTNGDGAIDRAEAEAVERRFSSQGATRPPQ
ncbi:MAG: protein-disulfide reductase DsbD family protein [Planctomycetota bacterium]|nr:protein-disulfide reductase DsbD family protein [Planctomycetota bacterium]